MQMSPKRKCHPNHMSPKCNVLQTQMSQKTQILPECNCYQSASVTKTQMSPKGKCYQNKKNFTKTQMSPKLKCNQSHQNANFPPLVCNLNDFLRSTCFFCFAVLAGKSTIEYLTFFVFEKSFFF